MPCSTNSALYDHFYHLASPEVTARLGELLRGQHIDVVSLHHFLHYGVEAIRSLTAEHRARVFVTLHEFLAICHHHGQMITRPALMLCERSSPTACTTCFPEHTRQQFALRQELFHSAFAGVDGFVSPSRFLADRFIEWGLSAARIAVIENGLANPPPLRASRQKPPNGAWVFGFFGQINPFKGVDVVLRAAELLSQKSDLAQRIRIRIHGSIVGQSQDFSEHFHCLLKKHEFLSYTGPYDNTSVMRLMGDCDYIVVPSLWWENSPMVIQEAYAAGRPVLCTGIGGMAEKVLDGASGLHFRLGEAADLLRAIDAAATPEMFRQLSAGLPVVTDAAAMARAYLTIFERMGAGERVDVSPR